MDSSQKAWNNERGGRIKNEAVFSFFPFLKLSELSCYVLPNKYQFIVLTLPQCLGVMFV